METPPVVHPISAFQNFNPSRTNTEGRGNGMPEQVNNLTGVILFWFEEPLTTPDCYCVPGKAATESANKVDLNAGPDKCVEPFLDSPAAFLVVSC
jgi:hypothetical protein